MTPSPSHISVLLVEDDAALREVMVFHLEEAGYRVTAAGLAQEALDGYDPDRFDVVITDIRMPDMSGLELLTALRERDPLAVVLVITAFGGTERALEAMRRGAFHYVEKPVNTRALIALLERAAEFRHVSREHARLTTPLRHELVAASASMNEVLRLVDKVANSDATVLILGESGTGKELIARAIHRRSERARAPFVTVSCAAIPADLLESTLFGHERGAFTGAHRASPGKFVAAEGGTLFLDEVGELPPALQSKLLRVLQEGEVDPVGATSPTRVNVRILAATHRDLEDDVSQGRFRKDLYWRLNVIPISLPPLRDRPEDIPVLVRFFLRKHAPEDTLTVNREVDERLLEHTWPGNVRELENTVKRMTVLRESNTLTVDDIPPRLLLSPSPPTAGLPFALPEDHLDLRALERDVIIAALDKHGGNQSATARYLKIPRHILTYRLEKYGIS